MDDSAGVRQLLSATLNGAGFEVQVAGGARDAVMAMAEGEFDAMVVDYSMPRSNGVELVRAMRAADVRVPIVMVSGVATQEEKRAAWEVGVNAYLDKFDLRQGVLTSTLRRLDRPRGSGYRLRAADLQRAPDVPDKTIRMFDQLSVTQVLAYLLPAVGVACVIWALAITRQGRQREREVVRLSEEAHRIKDDFVAMVSHELRTPLTSIAGFADTLVDSWHELPDEEVDEFLSIINRQAIYLGDLVEDVLVIPRLEADRLRFQSELFDLGDLIEDVAKMVFPNGGKKTSLVSLPDGVRVKADRRRVQQVIRNLMENARKYGGDQIMVEGFVMGDQYLIIISDNGPGVPDEETQKVFENFEQLSKGDAREATGIGLGLAYRETAGQGHGWRGLVRATVPHRRSLLLQPCRCAGARSLAKTAAPRSPTIRARPRSISASRQSIDHRQRTGRPDGSEPSWKKPAGSSGPHAVGTRGSGFLRDDHTVVIQSMPAGTIASRCRLSGFSMTFRPSPRSLPTSTPHSEKR